MLVQLILFGEGGGLPIPVELHVAPTSSPPPGVGTGNDTTGIGSLAAPYATLQKASQVAGAGTVILVHGGTYTPSGMQTITSVGTVTAWVIFKAAGDGPVIIDGVSATLAANDSLVRFSSASYCILDGMTFKNSTERGISVTSCACIIISNNTLFEIERRAIGGSGDDIAVISNRLYNCVMENENNALGGSGWASVISCFNWPDGHVSRRWLITGNNVSLSWGEGINFYHGTGSAFGNIIHDVWSTCFYLDAPCEEGVTTDYVTIKDNYCYSTNTTYYRDARPAHGVMMANEANGDGTLYKISVSNNILAKCGRGIHYWHSAANVNNGNTWANVTIEYNTITEPFLYSIDFDLVAVGRPDPSGGILRYNTIAKGADGNSLDLGGDQAFWTTIGPNNWPNGIPALDAHANSKALDPQFVNPLSGGPTEGFRPDVDSLLATGVLIAGLELDYSKRARHVLYPTLGALEKHIRRRKLS